MIFEHPKHGRFTLSAPEPTDDGNHMCVATVNGVGGPVYGVSPLGALENAITFMRAMYPLGEEDNQGWSIS
jgi:hypothetical protein